jgi:hypothetical protein
MMRCILLHKFARRICPDGVLMALTNGTAADLIHNSVQQSRTKITANCVRNHESGDIFTGAYLDAWIEVSQRNPHPTFS